MSRGTPIAERIEWWPRANLRPNPRNARTHSAEQLADLANMMRKVWTFPILVFEDADKPRHGEIIAGHGRFEAAPQAGYHDEVRVMVAENWTAEQIEQYVLFDNAIALNSAWDDDMLKAALVNIRDSYGLAALGGIGFSQDRLDELLNPQPPGRGGVKGSLAEAFGVPPFSVLVAREGWWQNRKKLWLELGIQSELGRADHVEGKASNKAAPKGGGRLYGGRNRTGKFEQQRTYGKPS